MEFLRDRDLLLMKILKTVQLCLGRTFQSPLSPPPLFPTQAEEKGGCDLGRLTTSFAAEMIPIASRVCVALQQAMTRQKSCLPSLPFPPLAWGKGPGLGGLTPSSLNSKTNVGIPMPS